MLVNILNLSDIHLGHDKNKTEDIILNLRRFFKTYNSKLKTLDLLTISGDIFDKLLTTNSADYHLAYEWLTELVLLCKRYGIKLRILEGTPSHDWQQAQPLHLDQDQQ
jgi:DNA repair exonuclease SbcCD nuclease subunit